MLILSTNRFSLSAVVVMLFLNGCAGSPFSQRANLGGSGSQGVLFQFLVGKYSHHADYSEVICLKLDDITADICSNCGVA